MPQQIRYKNIDIAWVNVRNIVLDIQYKVQWPLYLIHCYALFPGGEGDLPAAVVAQAAPWEGAGAARLRLRWPISEELCRALPRGCEVSAATWEQNVEISRSKIGVKF